jgi:hypothetical protein
VTAQAPIQFDRASGAPEGANLWERTAASALTTGSKISWHFSHRGHISCAYLLHKALPERNIGIKLNSDVLFAFPYGDGYWSKLLNRSYHYEDELELLFHGNDREHTLSPYILEKTPLTLVDPLSSWPKIVRELSILDRIKVSSHVGYNVSGTASAFWQNRINARNANAARRMQ